jgi:type I restriction enzyme, S subunit
MPSEWVSTTLGQVVRLQRGHDLPDSERRPGRIPILGSFGITGLHDKARASGPGVTVGRSGASIGVVAFSPVDFWPLNTCLYVTDFQGNDPKFCFYWLKTLNLASFDSGSAQPSLNRNYIYGLPVRIPNVPEQREIAKVLGGLDGRIELLAKTNTSLEAIARAIFKSWFVDFDPVRAKAEGREPEGMDAVTAALFPSKLQDSLMGPIPQGWKAGTLSDFVTFQNGYSFKSADWVASGFAVVKIGNVKPGLVSLNGCSYVTESATNGLDRFRLQQGDLLVGMTGYVGETGLVPMTDRPVYLNQRVGKLCAEGGLSNLGFVYCLVRPEEFKVFAEAQARGSAQANVSGASLLAYPAVVPEPLLLNAFNRLLEPLLEAILSHHRQAELLASIRDTLLPRLISGKLRRVSEAEEMVEAVL